jgi:hypothetical protein
MIFCELFRIVVISIKSFDYRSKSDITVGQ